MVDPVEGVLNLVIQITCLTDFSQPSTRERGVFSEIVVGLIMFIF